MRVTKELNRSDALLIAEALNNKFPRLELARERWPEVIMEDFGYVEYEKYRVCYLEITFRLSETAPRHLSSTLKGHVEIGQEQYGFDGFNPAEFSKEPQMKKLLEHLGILAREVLTPKRDKIDRELELITGDLNYFAEGH